MNIGDKKLPCPYCGKLLSWNEAIMGIVVPMNVSYPIPDDAYSISNRIHCIHCKKKISWACAIIPIKKYEWMKPSIVREQG
ncbi:MAG: hypothetical protein ACTSPB_04800 [Candidatus Thorarchaeota archaeon]